MNPSATAALSPDPQAEPFGRPASSLGRRVRVAIIGLALAGAAGVAFWAIVGPIVAGLGVALAIVGLREQHRGQ